MPFGKKIPERNEYFLNYIPPGHLVPSNAMNEPNSTVSKSNFNLYQGFWGHENTRNPNNVQQDQLDLVNTTTSNNPKDSLQAPTMLLGKSVPPFPTNNVLPNPPMFPKEGNYTNPAMMTTWYQQNAPPMHPPQPPQFVQMQQPSFMDNQRYSSYPSVPQMPPPQQQPPPPQHHQKQPPPPSQQQPMFSSAPPISSYQQMPNSYMDYQYPNQNQQMASNQNKQNNQQMFQNYYQTEEQISPEFSNEGLQTYSMESSYQSIEQNPENMQQQNQATSDYQGDQYNIIVNCEQNVDPFDLMGFKSSYLPQLNNITESDFLSSSNSKFQQQMPSPEVQEIYEMVYNRPLVRNCQEPHQTVPDNPSSQNDGANNCLPNQPIPDIPSSQCDVTNDVVISHPPSPQNDCTSAAVPTVPQKSDIRCIKQGLMDHTAIEGDCLRGGLPSHQIYHLISAVDLPPVDPNLDYQMSRIIQVEYDVDYDIDILIARHEKHISSMNPFDHYENDFFKLFPKNDDVPICTEEFYHILLHHLEKLRSFVNSNNQRMVWVRRSIMNLLKAYDNDVAETRKWSYVFVFNDGLGDYKDIPLKYLEKKIIDPDLNEMDENELMTAINDAHNRGKGIRLEDLCAEQRSKEQFYNQQYYQYDVPQQGANIIQEKQVMECQMVVEKKSEGENVNGNESQIVQKPSEEPVAALPRIIVKIKLPSNVNHETKQQSEETSPEKIQQTTVVDNAADASADVPLPPVACESAYHSEDDEIPKKKRKSKTPLPPVACESPDYSEDDEIPKKKRKSKTLKEKKTENNAIKKRKEESKERARNKRKEFSPRNDDKKSSSSPEVDQDVVKGKKVVEQTKQRKSSFADYSEKCKGKANKTTDVNYSKAIRNDPISKRGPKRSRFSQPKRSPFVVPSVRRNVTPPSKRISPNVKGMQKSLQKSSDDAVKPKEKPPVVPVTKPKETPTVVAATKPKPIPTPVPEIEFRTPLDNIMDMMIGITPPKTANPCGKAAVRKPKTPAVKKNDGATVARNLTANSNKNNTLAAKGDSTVTDKNSTPDNKNETNDTNVVKEKEQVQPPTTVVPSVPTSTDPSVTPNAPVVLTDVPNALTTTSPAVTVDPVIPSTAVPNLPTTTISASIVISSVSPKIFSNLMSRSVIGSESQSEATDNNIAKKKAVKVLKRLAVSDTCSTPGPKRFLAERVKESPSITLLSNTSPNSSKDRTHSEHDSSLSSTYRTESGHHGSSSSAHRAQPEQHISSAHRTQSGHHVSSSSAQRTQQGHHVSSSSGYRSQSGHHSSSSSGYRPQPGNHVSSSSGHRTQPGHHVSSSSGYGTQPGHHVSSSNRHRMDYENHASSSSSTSRMHSGHHGPSSSRSTAPSSSHNGMYFGHYFSMSGNRTEREERTPSRRDIFPKSTPNVQFQIDDCWSLSFGTGIYNVQDIPLPPPLEDETQHGISSSSTVSDSSTVENRTQSAQNESLSSKSSSEKLTQLENSSLTSSNSSTLKNTTQNSPTSTEKSSRKIVENSGSNDTDLLINKTLTSTEPDENVLNSSSTMDTSESSSSHNSSTAAVSSPDESNAMQQSSTCQMDDNSQNMPVSMEIDCNLTTSLENESTMSERLVVDSGIVLENDTDHNTNLVLSTSSDVLPHSPISGQSVHISMDCISSASKPFLEDFSMEVEGSFTNIVMENGMDSIARSAADLSNVQKTTIPNSGALSCNFATNYSLPSTSTSENSTIDISKSNNTLPLSQVNEQNTPVSNPGDLTNSSTNNSSSSASISENMNNPVASTSTFENSAVDISNSNKTSPLKQTDNDNQNASTKGDSACKSSTNNSVPSTSTSENPLVAASKSNNTPLLIQIDDDDPNDSNPYMYPLSKHEWILLSCTESILDEEKQKNVLKKIRKSNFNFAAVLGTGSSALKNAIMKDSDVQNLDFAERCVTTPASSIQSRSAFNQALGIFGLFKDEKIDSPRDCPALFSNPGGQEIVLEDFENVAGQWRKMVERKSSEYIIGTYSLVEFLGLSRNNIWYELENDFDFLVSTSDSVPKLLSTLFATFIDFEPVVGPLCDNRIYSKYSAMDIKLIIGLHVLCKKSTNSYNKLYLQRWLTEIEQQIIKKRVFDGRLLLLSKLKDDLDAAIAVIDAFFVNEFELIESSSEKNGPLDRNYLLDAWSAFIVVSNEVPDNFNKEELILISHAGPVINELIDPRSNPAIVKEKILSGLELLERMVKSHSENYELKSEDYQFWWLFFKNLNKSGEKRKQNGRINISSTTVWNEEQEYALAEYFLTLLLPKLFPNINLPFGCSKKLYGKGFGHFIVDIGKRAIMWWSWYRELAEKPEGFLQNQSL